jgi:amidase
LKSLGGGEKRMDQLAFQSASDLVKAIKERRLGSLELLDHYIKRIEKYNPAINAVVVTDFEKARARAADQAIQKGESWGLLHGLKTKPNMAHEMTIYQP